MRFINAPSLAVLAIAVATALIGASPASATSTSLCKVHQEPCPPPSQVTSFHLINTPGTVWELLNDIADILCLAALWQATMGALGAPQTGVATSVTLTTCGTTVAHNNATSTTIVNAKFTALKTALNLATLTTLSKEGGLINIKATILGFIKINCDFDLSGMSFQFEGALHRGSTTGHGMLTAAKTPIPHILGTNCPTGASLDFLLEPLEHTYIVG